MRNRSRFASLSLGALLSLSAALVGCGGGGGDSNPDAAVVVIVDSAVIDAPSTTVDGAVIDARPADAAPAVCDILANTGCTAPQKCTLIQVAGQVQIGCGMAGTGNQGATCQLTTTGDNCGPGYFCATEPGASASTCHSICNPAGGSTCPLESGSATECTLSLQQFPQFALCGKVTTCDLLTQNCPTGQACYVMANAQGMPTPRCAPEGTAAPGATCTAPNTCTKGSSCFMTGAGSQCLYHCNAPGGAPACSGAATGGATCQADTRISPTFGVCQ